MKQIEIDGVPIRVWKNGPQTLADVFRIGQAFPGREFIVDEDHRISYSAFGKAVAALSGELSRRGVVKGNVVAIIAANSPEWLAAFFAIVLIGGIAAPINPGAGPVAISAALDLSTTRIAFCDAERLTKLRTSFGDTEMLKELIVWRAPKGDLATSESRLEDMLGTIGEWSSLDSKPVTTTVEPEDDAAIFFTSGTTGQPKGVLTSHRANVYNVFYAAFRNARRYLMTGETPPEPDVQKAQQQICLVPHPLFHVSSLNASVIPLICRGGKIVFMRWWAAERALQLIEKERIDFLGGVPTTVCQVLDHPRRDRYDVACLTNVIYGGAPSPLHLPKQAAEAGIVAGQSWGMTETCGGLTTTIAAEFLDRPDSCGLPSAVHDLEVRNERGDTLGPGEVGELWVRGPQVMKRYWRDPKATAHALVDGWLRTGDLARLDADGYCYIVDRLKDMIICGGENIFCGEIETILASHPDVLEAAAIGIPHSSFGEQAAAVVTLREGRSLSEQDVRVFAARALPPIKVPARVVVSYDPLPRNEAGKVRKADLKQRFL